MRSALLAALVLAACRPSAVAHTGTTTVTVSTADARSLRLVIEPLPEPALIPLRPQQRARCGNGEMLIGLELASAPVTVDGAAQPRVRAFRLRCVEVSLTAGTVTFGAERMTEWRWLTGASDASPEGSIEGLRCGARTAAVDVSLDYEQAGAEPRRGLRGAVLHCANVSSRTTGHGVLLWGEESASPSTQRVSAGGGLVACGGVGLDQGPLTSVATGIAFVPEEGDEVGASAIGPLCSTVTVSN